MINKIIFSTFAICLFIAIPLAVMGYTKVELGEPFLALIQQVNKDLADFKIEIPDIPSIPLFENADGFLAVINVLIKFVNIIIWLLNALADLINVVLQLIQTIVLFVKALINFKDSIANYNTLPII